MKTYTNNLKLILLICLLFVSFGMSSQEPYVFPHKVEDGFALVTNRKTSPILYSDSDYDGVKKIISILQKDMEKVTGYAPKLYTNINNIEGLPVIIGSLNKSVIIDRLVENSILDVANLQGKWEKFSTQIVQNPLPGIEKALVVAGSDKRGTMYGILELSSQMGISPWHFWADVPPKKSTELWVRPGQHSLGEPKIKYRGIFINDEAPALSGWVHEHYGSFNAQFYEKVFELILRLKGNYLWPAMWGRMFYVDDPRNKDMAELYGIVMGTSHHEPLTRAHAEWEKFGEGQWDYSTNANTLNTFWKKGMERRGNTETIVTIGMRGDGDEPMSDSTATDLLQTIIKNQRAIIAETTGKPAYKTPQIWAIYKEVQDYYDKGLRAPEDVTTLFCDDNWGNIRKLPHSKDLNRPGGYGIYYHFDYVGGPRNYKWINTNQIERTWEQMHLAYEHGVKQIWIVNVGDIKPMEFPISFFLDYAWNPEKWKATNLPSYYTQWAESIFGKTHAKEIGNLLKTYTKYNARRKPELLSPNTYSLNNYMEVERICTEFDSLVTKAQHISEQIPDAFQDTYYQLVLFPILASANLNSMYIEAAKNKMYAEQGRSLTNETAEKVEALFNEDAALTNYYHTQLADGKWNHMMSQTHIGYTSWQEPPKNTMPQVQTIKLKEKSEMGIAVEGSSKWYPRFKDSLVLPEFISLSDENRYVEIFNRGKKSFQFTIKSENNWLAFSETKGSVSNQKRIFVQLHPDRIPEGRHRTYFTVQDKHGQKVKIEVNINKVNPNILSGFIENDGYIAMEAENYSRAVGSQNVEWTNIPNLGKTSSGMTTIPTTANIQEITGDSPRLEFDFYAFREGPVKIHAYFSPTLNYNEAIGHHYGIGIDNSQPQTVNFHEDDNPYTWNKWVADNIKVITTSHELKSGHHTLKYYMKNSGLVLQKIVIETGKLKESYLGPKQSLILKK